MSQVQVLVGWRCHAGAHGRSILAWCQAARSRAHEPQRPGAGPDRGRVPNVCAHETAPQSATASACRVHASSSLGVCLFPLALTNWLHSSRPLQELSTARPSRCRYPYRTQTLRHTLNTSHDATDKQSESRTDHRTASPRSDPPPTRCAGIVPLQLSRALSFSYSSLSFGFVNLDANLWWQTCARQTSSVAPRTKNTTSPSPAYLKSIADMWQRWLEAE
jgi:hypothetical protein